MDNSFFSKFAPKEPKFFPLLKQMAEVSVIAAKLLVESLEQSSYEKSVEYYKLIKEQEKRGDVLLTTIFEQLNVSFITPFDREDINHLANELDNVTDYINGSAKKIVLYHPKKIPGSALTLAKHIKECVDSVVILMNNLSALRKNATIIKTNCELLRELENRADDTYEHFLIDLFDNEIDSKEIIKLTEIMGVLEKATDAADYIGKIVKNILVKYS
ncbi:hypothetical protein FACS1894178_6840 [Bacteroidia bacterium]|nr:hypothetical protein FACS1894178_6840 [Bacteroidia bacterium]